MGNSNAIRLPKVLLNSVGLMENDRVEISTTENGFVISKIKPHKTLKDRVESYYGKPIDEINKINNGEIDWGKPAGEELW